AGHVVALLGAGEAGADGERYLGHAYHYLGEVALGRDEPRRAEGFFRHSLALRQRGGDQAATGWSWLALSTVAWTRCDLAQAEEWGGHSQAIFTRLGHEQGLAQTWMDL